MNEAFPEWFQAQVLKLCESTNLSDNFFSLVMGPSFDVCCYNGCIVSGLRFHTFELDSRRTIQNSGLMVIGESDASESDNNNFYGVLDEVSHVQYPLGRNDVLEVEDVENKYINVVEIVVSHRVDDHIEDDTLCRTDVDPTIVERPVLHHVIDDFIDDTDETFLEFENDLDNLAEGSFAVDDNSRSSSQPPTTPTPRKRAQPRLLELERYVTTNVHIMMMIALSVKKPFFSYVVRFSQAIGACHELVEERGEAIDCVELFWQTHVRFGMFVSQAAKNVHNKMLKLQF
ncbi:CACTA en-spm transposon protein [Cucumis melo var. makuwa]|uniref:CACTA en-spm transposon protein n=1 Tax=Cucumis melo var. makuwa TaxID=1194695 RepID=A0A5A7VAA1_CUCMM|nr:CACTA en-spm transposon protein [Cucumis melo var. makuwa]